jgi:GT2 family glycosyltransferase
MPKDINVYMRDKPASASSSSSELQTTSVFDSRWLLKGKRGAASIIIPCHNALDYTKQCLESLQRWTDFPHDLIVIDNGSQDGTWNYLKSLKRRWRGAPLVLIRNSSNFGFPKAVNQGMRVARGEFLVWLNTDVIVTPHWLRRLAGCASRDSHIGAVGPQTNMPGATLGNSEFLPAFSEALALKHHGLTKTLPLLFGFCFLVKREVVLKIGALDERFGLGCQEDFDYCVRINQAGYETVLVREVFVWHYWHKSFRNLRDQKRQAQRSVKIFFDKKSKKEVSALERFIALANLQICPITAPWRGSGPFQTAPLTASPAVGSLRPRPSRTH